MDNEEVKKVQLQHGAPAELWDLEMELSNICAYAGGKNREQLAQRFIQLKTKVRKMIREYGYKGAF